MPRLIKNLRHLFGLPALDKVEKGTGQDRTALKSGFEIL
jgi:hypothetical protein